MKPKRIISVIFILFNSCILFSQNVAYSYDENGNRLAKTIIVEQLRSNSFTFPVLNPKDLKSNSEEYAKTKESEEVKSDQEAITTVVYPNPNKGLIKIDILNMPSNAKTDMRLYNVNGAELIVKRNFENYSEVDITKFKEGTYILRIKINETIFDWKIIKNN